MLTVLGIETSCDETAAAVVSAEGDVLSDVVRSQVALHAPYGGVVPEVAARDHALALPAVIEQALAAANLELRQLDGIAVTHRPGLAGALLVGLLTAKGLAWGAGKPLIGVDHLVGHMLAIFLRRQDAPPPPAFGRAIASSALPLTAPTRPPSRAAELAPAFPFIALLVSGGHTAIYRVNGPALANIQELGATRDDAAGEAFDKVAKLLGLGYPGGPAVDRLAALGDAARAPIQLPRPMSHRASLELSFSGIKSAIARHIELRGVPAGDGVADLCAAFQETVVGVLVRKTIAAAEREGLTRIVLGGGVAANRGLRAKISEAAAVKGFDVFIPPLASCTDNAAMIAYAGALALARGERDGFELRPATRTALLTVTRKGGGRRSSDPERAAQPPRPEKS